MYSRVFTEDTHIYDYASDIRIYQCIISHAVTNRFNLIPIKHDKSGTKILRYIMLIINVFGLLLY